MNYQSISFIQKDKIEISHAMLVSQQNMLGAKNNWLFLNFQTLKMDRTALAIEYFFYLSKKKESANGNDATWNTLSNHY